MHDVLLAIFRLGRMINRIPTKTSPEYEYEWSSERIQRFLGLPYHESCVIGLGLLCAYAASNPPRSTSFDPQSCPDDPTVVVESPFVFLNDHASEAHPWTLSLYTESNNSYWLFQLSS